MAEASVLAGSAGLPFTGQAEGARPELMLYVASETLEEKLCDYERAIRTVGQILHGCGIGSDGRLFVLSSRLLTGSGSQITSPLKCDYNIPPAITIIT